MMDYLSQQGLSVSKLIFYIGMDGNWWLPGGLQINLKVIVYFGKQSAGMQNIGDLYLMG